MIGPSFDSLIAVHENTLQLISYFVRQGSKRMNRFPTTRWTLVHKAATESQAGSREQMGQLLERYWLPMFTHLKLKGVRAEKAEDLIQDFVIEIINRELLSIADPKKGKLRTLLLTSLDRFAISQHRKDTAAKRSPGKIASLDAVQSDETKSGDMTPSHAFDRAWGLDILSQSLADMRRECDERDEGIRWQVFERRVLGPLLDDADAPSFKDLAGEFGLASEKTAMNRLITAKRQFARHLREAVRGYVRPRAAGSGSTPNENGQQPPDVTRTASDMQVSYQLAEHAARQDVEREIDELRHILGRSRAAVSIAGDIPSDAMKADPIKSEFWHRLTRQHDSGDKTLAEMFSFGTANASDDEEVAMDICLTDTLDTDLQSFPGLEYTGPGTLRQLIDDPEAPLELFQRAKDWVNVSRLGGDVTLPENIANGVYFLILAAAFIHHGQQITGLEDYDLRTGYDWLLDQTWFEDAYRPLIQSAIDKLE